ncbi:hypothetical protein [Bradyrhizobium sp. WSM3983]|uniref:hypothetical protein n=1 Tax=Bradyrhizobium sp. WSM3983 TaxID=1038867 RepID=UPI000481E5F9|nr:hypothetical protein [Bradyrhizobium sp. WSM3983]
MGLSELFLDHEPKMRDLFTRLAAEYGLIDDRESTLELVDTDNRMLFRSIPSTRLIKIEWRGVASLWAASQAMGRLGPAIFAARRKRASGSVTPDQSQEQLGLQFITYEGTLCSTEVAVEYVLSKA